MSQVIEVSEKPLIISVPMIDEQSARRAANGYLIRG